MTNALSVPIRESPWLPRCLRNPPFISPQDDLRWSSSSGGDLLCGSCGYENPRGNRYCGMCGTPFPHRPLTVPDAQSTLTFSSAPIEVAQSSLTVGVAEVSHLETTPPRAQIEVEEAPPAPLESTPVAPPPAKERAQPITPEKVSHPGPDLSQPAKPEHMLPPSAVAEPLVDLEPPPEQHVEAPISIAEAAAFETASEKVPSIVPHAEMAPPGEGESAPVPREPRPSLAAERPAPPIEVPAAIPEPEPEPPAAPSIAAEPVSETPVSPPVAAQYEPPPPHEDIRQPGPSGQPEIRRYSPPPRKIRSAPVASTTRTPTAVPRPRAPQSTEPPPPSAGMPTFQSVAEAAGAPAVSLFEPAVATNADDERDLQEFIANFRYNPPEESVDELTMRSEVPVLDAEGPVTPSHPSFDDDVPPPAQAGPHPTGEEYYARPNGSSNRTRFLDVGESPKPGPESQAPARPSPSFLGIDDVASASTPTPARLDQPVRRRWLLWSSLAVLAVVFGAVGFFQGRFEITHAYQRPLAAVREQYGKLRQRVSEWMPAAPAASPAAETPAQAQPESKSPSPDQSATTAEPDSSANANPTSRPGSEPATTSGQAQPQPDAGAPQSTPATDNDNNEVASTSTSSNAPTKLPADTQPKPAADAATANPVGQAPAVPKTKSKPDPGQRELAQAMQASDPAAAAAWLWRATSRGNPEAPIRLADMYIKGKGVPHSCEQALVLLRSVAAKENAPARNRLAALYANGTCVARDRVRAYQLMSSALAVDPTSEWAETNRKELWRQMTPEERVLAGKYR